VSEELEVLKIVAGRLDEAGIPYMVTGSMALNYYAVPRMTRDIDLVVEVAPVDTERLCELFQEDFYLEPETVREAVARAGTFNLIHTRLIVKVDMVVRKSDDYRRTEFGRRRRVSLDDRVIVVVAPEDLVISKLHWASQTRSEVQLGDVRNVLQSVAALDRTYLEHWIGHLGLEALYREVAS
jgi:hypothetical protein